MKILIILLVTFFSSVVFTQEINISDIKPLNGYIVKTDTIHVMKHNSKGDGKVLSFDFVCSFFINNIDKEILIYANGVYIDHYKIKSEKRNDKQVVYSNRNRKYKSKITLDFNGQTTSLYMIKRKRFQFKEIHIFSKNMYFDDVIILNGDD
jgi:hypothetical protein